MPGHIVRIMKALPSGQERARRAGLLSQQNPLSGFVEMIGP
jgi:hypothetical protein